jgi:hypothetical protein
MNEAVGLSDLYHVGIAVHDIGKGSICKVATFRGRKIPRNG